MTNILSFPGLGIGEFEIRRDAFKFLFGRDVMWYGIIITFGIVLGFCYALYRSKRENISSDDVLDYGIYCVISAVIGARLYYVSTYGVKGETLGEKLYNIVAIWDGGIAIYGAIIAGAVAIVLVSKFKKINVMSALDMICPGVMIGQIIGRWGNFFNIEAFGGPTTLPWRMCSPVVANDFIEKGLIDLSGYQQVLDGTLGAHPTFLYESLWNLIGFLIINAHYKKKRYNGQIFLMYISWYGLGRMFIEGLRTDSLMVGSFRISQLIGFACFIIGSILLIVLGIANSRKKAKNNDIDVTTAESIDGDVIANETCECTKNIEGDK